MTLHTAQQCRTKSSASVQTKKPPQLCELIQPWGYLENSARKKPRARLIELMYTAYPLTFLNIVDI